MLPVGFQRLLGKDGRGLWSFLSAEVGGRQVRADLVRFLPPSTLGGWAGFLASLGRPGLPLGNIRSPRLCAQGCVSPANSVRLFSSVSLTFVPGSLPNFQRILMPGHISLLFRPLTAQQKHGWADTVVSLALQCVSS